MAYDVKRSNGTLLTTIADNTTDNFTTSLTLLGHNTAGYGASVANNFVHLLENSAADIAPSPPLKGQLWYDTGNSVMKLHNGTSWVAMSAGVSSLIGLTGAITLDQLVDAGLALSNSAAFAGTPTAPTAALNTNTTQLATTAFVMNQLGTITGGVSSVVGSVGAVTLSQLIAGGVAPLGSPTFTGTPSGPTPDVGTNTTQLATTAFVINQVGALSTGVSSVAGQSGAVSLVQLNTAGVALKASPAFTGTPTAPTAPPGTNTQQLATTAFVGTAISNAAPSVRTRVTGNVTLYVSPAGNDTTGNGSAGSPFATMQAAYTYALSNLDGANSTLILQLVNGTHSSGVRFGRMPPGFSLITVQGNVSNNASVLINALNSNCFWIDSGATVLVQNLSMSASTGTGQTGNCIVVSNGGGCLLGPVIFQAATAYHLLVQIDSVLSCTNSYTISAGAGYHVGCTTNSTVIFNGNPNSAVTTINGNPTFGGSFASASGLGVINFDHWTFSGTAVGTKYNSVNNSVISLSAVADLPGSTSGMTANGGIYG